MALGAEKSSVGKVDDSGSGGPGFHLAIHTLKKKSVCAVGQGTLP